MDFAYIFIVYGLLFYIGVTNAHKNYLKKDGRKFNFFTYCIPIYQVNNHNEYFYRSGRWMGMIWLLIGLILLLLLKLGVIQDGTYISIIGIVIFFTSLFTLGLREYKETVKKHKP